MIDTHIHIDGEEFQEDLADVIARAKEANCEMMLVPAINKSSIKSIQQVCEKYADYLVPMMGLHPEDVKEDWQEVLSEMKPILKNSKKEADTESSKSFKAAIIGEVGLDYYWSREYEKEQLLAFEEQVKWSVEMQLPLCIHCRKAQNEMLSIMKKYKNNLPGGVFHCFTGNSIEAAQLLQYENFMLGIGGVLTFKKSNLPDTLRESVSLSRIVLETDAPYMAPVPMRGKRNESSFIPYIMEKLAEVYDTTVEEIDRITTENAKILFKL